MFRRKKRDSADGDHCPYCEFVNLKGAEQCVQCYYVMNKAARNQPMAAPSSTDNELMATLMSEEAPDQEEDIAVEAVLSMGEVTVEIEQGQLPDEGENDSFGFIKAGNPTLSETIEYESPTTTELDVSDAPSAPVNFVIEAHDPMAEVTDPVPTGVGNLYSPMTKTAGNDDLKGSVGPEPNTIPMTPDLPDLPGEAVAATPNLPVAQAISAAVQPPAVPLPETKTIVALPPVTPEVPDAPAVQPVVQTPSLPFDTVAATPDVPTDAPSTPELPEIVESQPVVVVPEPQHNNRIWPWPAKEPWDPRQVYREVVAVLEAIKTGKLVDAAKTLDLLGPHLEDNLDMLLHIGAAMRQLGREEHLQWTLSMAQHVHPNDEHVTAAVAQLGKGA